MTSVASLGDGGVFLLHALEVGALDISQREESGWREIRGVRTARRGQGRPAWVVHLGPITEEEQILHFGDLNGALIDRGPTSAIEGPLRHGRLQFAVGRLEEKVHELAVVDDGRGTRDRCLRGYRRRERGDGGCAQYGWALGHGAGI